MCLWLILSIAKEISRISKKEKQNQLFPFFFSSSYMYLQFTHITVFGFVELAREAQLQKARHLLLLLVCCYSSRQVCKAENRRHRHRYRQTEISRQIDTLTVTRDQLSLAVDPLTDTNTNKKGEKSMTPHTHAHNHASSLRNICSRYTFFSW